MQILSINELSGSEEVRFPNLRLVPDRLNAAVLFQPLRLARCRLCLVNSYTPALNYLQVFYTSVLPAHNQMFHVKVFNS